MKDIHANRRDMLRATAGFTGASLLGILRISPALAAISPEAIANSACLTRPRPCTEWTATL